jgi:hypothetical protein
MVRSGCNREPDRLKIGRTNAQKLFRRLGLQLPTCTQPLKFEKVMGGLVAGPSGSPAREEGL